MSLVHTFNASDVSIVVKYEQGAYRDYYHVNSRFETTAEDEGVGSLHFLDSCFLLGEFGGFFGEELGFAVDFSIKLLFEV